MTIQSYLPTPHLTQAVQFTPDFGNDEAEWILFDVEDMEIEIRTEDGAPDPDYQVLIIGEPDADRAIWLEHGDWLVRACEGTFYALSDDAFQATFRLPTPEQEFAARSAVLRGTPARELAEPEEYNIPAYLGSLDPEQS
jgi:hypothetical protein